MIGRDLPVLLVPCQTSSAGNSILQVAQQVTSNTPRTLYAAVIRKFERLFGSGDLVDALR